MLPLLSAVALWTGVLLHEVVGLCRRLKTAGTLPGGVHMTKADLAAADSAERRAGRRFVLVMVCVSLACLTAGGKEALLLLAAPAIALLLPFCVALGFFECLWARSRQAARSLGATAAIAWAPSLLVTACELFVFMIQQSPTILYPIRTCWIH